MENESQISVLVVDNEEDYRALLYEVLTKEGYRVIVTDSPEIARGLLVTASFALAIFDMRLTDSCYDVQGLDLVREAKKLCPSIKAIVLTGFPDPEQRSRALEVYMADGYYEKAPGGKSLRIEDFRQIVRDLLL